MRALDERELIEYVTAQRWYGSKGREVARAGVVDHVELPGLMIAMLELVFPEGTHEVYQLLAGETGEGFADAAVGRELVHLIRTGASQRTGGDGTIDFRPVEGFAGLGTELVSSRPISSEQSNSSVVFDDALYLKAFRRLEPGLNPDLEMLRFLTDHGFRNIPPLGGWYSFVGAPLDATLGILQAFVPNGQNGWDLALDELAGAPDRFLGRVRGLGEVVGTMHAVLASDPNDASFSPETPSLESLGLLTASVDEEIEQLFLSLPDDAEALEPIRGRGEEIRDHLRQLTHAATTGRAIRNHGDLHLARPCSQATRGSSSTSRASPRARSPSAAASVRRSATSPGCCARSRTRPPPPGSCAIARRRPAGRTRRGRGSSTATRRRSTRRSSPQGRSSSRSCSPSLSSRRRSTSCATSCRCGRTGCQSRSPGSSGCSSRR